MLKKITASALRDRLQALRPSRQTMLRRLKQGGVVVVAFGSLYLIAPPLWDAISVSPQQRVKPLKQRINDLDKQIKASKTPSTADLKEIATLEKGRIDTENTIRTSLFQAVGGLLVFVTLYISWLTLKANEAKQVAERFSDAVEQLGNDNIHVRLGGIYALEQIAKDAEEKYYWQVIETLTSYVRERSPWNKEKEAQAEQEIPPLPTDIQAVMTVIARRKYSYGHPLERYPLNLSNADLRRLQLPPKARFSKANFSKTNLQKAKLWEVNLQNADFWRANLQGTQFHEANLQEVSFSEADLQDADLSSASLQRAFLYEAKLQNADLYEVDMQNAECYKADLQNVFFGEANLQNANFYKVNLQNVDLWGASLQNVDFSEANLKGAKFKQTDLKLVALYGIQEAIGLTWKQLNAAASYEGAILPDYLPLRPQQPQTELTQSANQSTASVQAEGETAATPPEETQLAPPES